MAKYTVEIRDIVKSGLKIFDFPYTFYDEAKKPEFEEMFINHFYFREIGTETVGRFQHYLKCKCQERLPYYNVLLKTSLYEYDVKNNYNLTETFTKTTSNVKTATGDISQNGTIHNTETASTDKTNTLNSQTSHTENLNTQHTEQINESGKLDKTSILDIDNKQVESDTPSGLLTLTDIKTNVYASKANIEDSLNKTTDTQSNSATKSNATVDTSNNIITDNINATSIDHSTDSTTNNGTTSNATSTEQTENDNGSESYTLERVGDIGVDTTPDKLKKHIEIQKILTTVYTQFFDECEDLFMQLY